MKKAKQLLVCLLVVFMVAALFAGCSGSDNKDKAGEASKTSEEKTASGEKNTKKSAEKASEESSKNPVEGKRIGVAHISKYDEWCAAVSNEFESQGKALGFAEINVQDGNLDHETQLKQIENFITKEYDMIIVDPVNPEGIIEVLERVDAAGIPVICFDSQTNWDKLVSYVAWDHAATGELMGKYVRKYI